MMPMADNWSRRIPTKHSLFGIKLSSKRRVTALLLGGTILSCWLLTTHYHLILPDAYVKNSASTSLGHQAFATSFKQSSQLPISDASTSSSSSSSSEYPSISSSEDDDIWSSMSGLGDEGGYSPFTKTSWDPQSSNPTPITEIVVKTCVLPPGKWGDLCAPTSSKKEDATRGEWIRVDKDLNKRVGIYYAFLYIRRLPQNSKAAVITNITLLTHSPTSSDLPGSGLWVEVSESIRTGVWPRMKPMFLHYRLTEQSEVLSARKSLLGAGELEPITELDVLYGSESEVKPLFGFERVKGMITGGEDDEKAMGTGNGKGTRPGSGLAVRRANKSLPPTPTLNFSPIGNYTILQVADLHFSVGPGKCRDMDMEHEEMCKAVGADRYSLEWLEVALDEIKPDLVVFSGDQLNGQDTSWSTQSVILKWAPLIYSRQLPWTAIFGNHDAELDLSNEEAMKVMTRMPYFVGEEGPTGVDGDGNYYRAIKDPNNKNDLFSLYFLDSHANAKSINPFDKSAYDWLKPNQINWFRSISSRVGSYKRPFTPPRSGYKSSSSSAASSRPVTTGRPKQPSSTRRPSKPIRPSYATESDDEDDEEGKKKMKKKKRQEDDAIVDLDLPSEAEVEEIEKEIEANPNIGIDFGMEPDDGSNVKEEDENGYSFTGSKEEEAEEDPLPIVDEEEDPWEEEPHTPTRLAAGPTKDSPMTAKPNAIAFFHIPLPEAYDATVDTGKDGHHLTVGERLEGKGSPKFNSGFFKEAILAQGEIPDTSKDKVQEEFWEGEFSNPTKGRPEVKVVANGHCHISSDCRRVNGVWLCFGGGGSYSGYAQSSFSRRMRVYQLSSFGETIETYQLLDTRERVDRTILVGEGAYGDS